MRGTQARLACPKLKHPMTPCSELKHLTPPKIERSAAISPAPTMLYVLGSERMYGQVNRAREEVLGRRGRRGRREISDYVRGRAGVQFDGFATMALAGTASFAGGVCTSEWGPT